MGLLLSSNAFAKEIKLVCVDNDGDADFNLKINTSNKTAIMQGRTASIKITEDEFDVFYERGDLSGNIIINRNSGTYSLDAKSKDVYQTFYGKCEIAEKIF